MGFVKRKAGSPGGGGKTVGKKTLNGPLSTKKSKWPKSVGNDEPPKKVKKKGSKAAAEERPAKLLSIEFPEEGQIEWSAIKQQSKSLTETRKQKKFKTCYDQVQAAKRQFEKFRHHKCQGAERAALVSECAATMRGLLAAKARSHDVARLIQWLLKLGSPEVRAVVVDEILGDAVTLAKCKYSSHIVRSLVVSCGSPARRRLVKQFAGHVVRLLSSKLSAPILDDVYAKYATASERSALRQELYGGNVWKAIVSQGARPSLASVLVDNPALAPSILAGVKSTLTKLLDKSWLLGSSIVMSALSEYLGVCGETERTELLTLLRGHVVSIICTKAGAEVGLVLLTHSTAKEKKDIVKEVKGGLTNIAASLSGSLFLQHLVDSVDDTVLLRKALLPTIIDSADELVSNEHGRKLLSYLVVHRDGHFFHPVDINRLRRADQSSTVKKSTVVRMKELQETLVPALLDKAADSPQVWLRDGATSLLTVAIVERAPTVAQGIAHLSAIFDAITSHMVAAVSIDDPGVHKAVKRIVKGDLLREQNSQPTLSRPLAAALDSTTLNRWAASNRGCFVLVFLLESGLADVAKSLSVKLAAPKLAQTIAESPTKGAEILRQLLK